MEVAVLGAGYVGLVQAAGLASTGNDVYLADISKERIAKLRQGECPIYEPGLSELLRKGADKGYIHFFEAQSAEFHEKLLTSEVIFIAVGTPEGSDGLPQLNYVLDAADALSKLQTALNDKIVVVKSTVPVGTGDTLEAFFSSKGLHPKVVSNPEFLKQGNAVQDFLKPERIIIGTHDEVARKTLSFLYKPFMMKRERIVLMKRRSAELVKYACNSFLAVKISYINEIARLAESVNADIHEIREGMLTDSRIGDQFLFPGVGYGGSCLPKDTHALAAQAKKAGASATIIEAADQINLKQKLWAFEKLQNYFSDNLKNKRIAIWGLAFKPNTDDLREAPSLHLIQRLIESGAKIAVHDPAALEKFSVTHEKEISDGTIETFKNPYDCIKECNALVVMTEWQEYRTPNFRRIMKELKQPLIVDCRNIYPNAVIHNMGFTHYEVGCASINKS